MIRSIESSKISKIGLKLGDLSFDVVELVNSFIQTTDFSYVNKDFYNLNIINVSYQISKISKLLNNKFLFFRNIAIDKKGKKKDFIKKCFLDISNIFKREFPHYYKIMLDKYSENSFSCKKIEEMVQIILDVNSIIFVILLNNNNYEHDFFDKLEIISIKKYLKINDNNLLEDGSDEEYEEREYISSIEQTLFNGLWNRDILHRDSNKIREFLKTHIELQEALWIDFSERSKFFKNLRFLFTFPFEMESFINLIGLELEYVNVKFLSVKLPNLIYLKLEFSKIKHIPFDIAYCVPHLKILSLSNNNIKTIPKIISKLKLIKQIDLSYNKIKKIPEWLFELLNKIHIDLTNNCLEEELLEKIKSIMPPFMVIEDFFFNKAHIVFANE